MATLKGKLNRLVRAIQRMPNELDPENAPDSPLLGSHISAIMKLAEDRKNELATDTIEFEDTLNRQYPDGTFPPELAQLLDHYETVAADHDQYIVKLRTRLIFISKMEDDRRRDEITQAEIMMRRHSAGSGFRTPHQESGHHTPVADLLLRSGQRSPSGQSSASQAHNLQPPASVFFPMVPPAMISAPSAPFVPSGLQMPPSTQVSATAPFASGGLPMPPIAQVPIPAPAVSFRNPAPQPSVTTQVRLPKLELVKFHGEPSKWRPFWCRFYNSVDRNQSLSGADKLNYLTMSLTGNPLSMVAGLDATDENYAVAVRTLTEAYGDPMVAIEELEAGLYRLETPRCDTVQLRRFYCDLENYIGSLKGLGQDVTGHHLVGLIMSKLPYSVVTNIERNKDPAYPWTVDLLRRHLRREVEIREASDRRCNKKPPDPKKSPFTRTVSTTEALPGQDTGNTSSGIPYQNTAFKSPCIFCQKKGHRHEDCRQVPSIEERRKVLFAARKCFRCLRMGHRTENCRNISRTCFHCKQSGHHRIVCPQKFGTSSTRSTTIRRETAAQGDERVFYMSGAASPSNGINPQAVPVSLPDGLNTEIGHLADDEHTILKTALVEVSSPESRSTAKVRIFLDSGCSRTYITGKLAKQLKLRTESAQSLTVNRFGGGTRHTIQVETATIALHTIDGQKFAIKVAVTPDIMNRMTRVAVNTSIMKRIPQNIQLADTPIAKNADVEIDLLLGNDYYDEFVTGERMDIMPGLKLISSQFGWIMSGRVADDTQAPHQIVALYAQEIANLQVPEDHLVVESAADDFKSTAMEDLWNLESIGITDNPNPASDDSALEQFHRTVKFEKGRYQVTWPWRDNADELPSNYAIAKRRLETTVNRLRQTPGLIERYDGVIQDQLKKEVIEEVSAETQNRTHYLPHREVLTPDKETTKLRIVYDASARAGPNKPSLNDCLHRGLVFMTALVCLLMRFTLFPIMVISDIEKAFLQVGLQEYERDVTRFLWLRDLTKGLTPENIIILRFTRVAFGMSPSPFLLGATIVHHLRQSLLPIARLIEGNTYVDNVVTGFRTVVEAMNFYTQSKLLFRQAGMNLREFASNSQELMASIPEVDRTAKSVTKVLGVGWDMATDKIYLNLPKSFPAAKTKRQVMQGLLKVYDPLGWVSPVIVRSRILLQRLCKGRSKNWNDPVSTEDVETYDTIVADYGKLRDLRWPRYVGHGMDNQCRIQCFCDASKDAYATVVYLQHRDGDRFTSRILFSKARVSPLGKTMTIPRLELLALLIGVRAVKCVREYLGFNGRTIIWSDSQCVLKWLGSNRFFGTFVDNRLREIRKLPNAEFKYVPTKDNPADLPSRGVSTADLSDFWWKGPVWSTGPDAEWPNIEVEIKQTRDESDAEGVSLDSEEACLSATSVISPPFGLCMERRSTYESLLRITAWCLRFERLTRRMHYQTSDFLHQVELQQAEALWIKYVQDQSFAEVKRAIKLGKPHILRNQLGLAMDSDGIIRCRGRMGEVKVPLTQRFPILLPSKGHFTKLLVEHYHRLCLHGGRRITLNTLRRKFWILHGATAVWNLLKDCQICRKVAGVGFARPPMPDLPAYRVNREFPFSHTGIDYFGPMQVRSGPDIVKRWGCIFTCLTTRAVHLELVSTLSADDFLMALRRFSSRRGRPKLILCDNGSQFCAIKRNDMLSRSSAGPPIEWRLITALSPWKGGVYERLIASVKSALKKSIGKALLSSEQLATLLAEIEYTLNSRPLTSSTEKETEVAITPNDLLGVSNLGDADESATQEYRHKQGKEATVVVEAFKRTRNILNDFWDIWRNDYLNELRDSHRLRHKDPKGSTLREPEPGEVVIVKDAKTVRNQWPLAIIEGVYRSQDGAIRGVEVRLHNGTKLSRPVNLIYPLEIKCQESSTYTSKQTIKDSTLRAGTEHNQPNTVQNKDGANVTTITTHTHAGQSTQRPQRTAAQVATLKNRKIAKLDLI